MLAEIFMLWLESQRREQTLPLSSNRFVPFDRATFGSFKEARACNENELTRLPAAA
jgi:hypothetical protein